MDQSINPNDITKAAEEWLRRTQNVADQRRRLEERFQTDPQCKHILHVFDHVAAWSGDLEQWFSSEARPMAVAKFCIFCAEEFAKSVTFVTNDELAKLFMRMFIFGYKLAMHKTNS